MSSIRRASSLAIATRRVSRAPRSIAGRSRLVGDCSGAAYVEFLIAFFPILLLFVGLLQLQLAYLTQFFVTRAAFAAARAAAVYIAQPDADGHVTHELTDETRAAVDDAVLLGVAPVLLRGWLGELPFVMFPDSTDPNSTSERTSFAEGSEMVRVRLFAAYVCHLPPLDLVMCEAQGGRRVMFLSSEATFPYQRASYQYDVEKE